MNNKNLFVSTLVMALLFGMMASGCDLLNGSLNQSNKTQLTVEPRTLTFAADETATKTVKVTSSSDWSFTFMESLSFCTISKQGNNLLVTPKSANTASSDRTLSIVITNADGYSGVTVTQQGTSSGGATTWTDGTAGYDIYLCGKNSGGYATYWKNGVAYINKNETDTYDDLAVSNGDVYALAYDRYYKNNGSAVILNGNSPLGQAIAASGTTVYVAGFTNDYSAVCWKNGTATYLPNGSTDLVEDLALSGSDVYVIGNTSVNGAALYWKNNVMNTLPNGGLGSSEALSVITAGSDFYIAGKVGSSTPCYWKNGTLKTLPMTSGWVGTTREAVDIAVSPNGDTHILGSDYFNVSFGVNSYSFKYWKNGVEAPTGGVAGDVGMACSIAVAGNDVYILVCETLTYTDYLYKNGKLIAATNPGEYFVKVVAVPK